MNSVDFLNIKSEWLNFVKGKLEQENTSVVLHLPFPSLKNSVPWGWLVCMFISLIPPASQAWEFAFEWSLNFLPCILAALLCG